MRGIGDPSFANRQVPIFSPHGNARPSRPRAARSHSASVGIRPCTHAQNAVASFHVTPPPAARTHRVAVCPAAPARDRTRPHERIGRTGRWSPRCGRSRTRRPHTVCAPASWTSTVLGQRTRAPAGRSDRSARRRDWTDTGSRPPPMRGPNGLHRLAVARKRIALAQVHRTHEMVAVRAHREVPRGDPRDRAGPERTRSDCPVLTVWAPVTARIAAPPRAITRRRAMRSRQCSAARAEFTSCAGGAGRVARALLGCRPLAARRCFM